MVANIRFDLHHDHVAVFRRASNLLKTGIGQIIEVKILAFSPPFANSGIIRQRNAHVDAVEIPYQRVAVLYAVAEFAAF